MAPSHSGLYIYVSVQFGEQELKYALKSIQYVAICDLDRHMYVYSECLCQFPVAAARNYQKKMQQIPIALIYFLTVLEV